MLSYLNGQFIQRSAATVSVEDRGFVFGDGVYEVWRVVNGQLFETDRHIARLAFGLRELRITPPTIAQRDALVAVADRLLTENDLLDGEATLYLEITRGAALRTHAFPPANTPPTAFVTVSRLAPQDDLRERGASVICVPDIRWLRCDIKTVQLLPNVLAAQAAAEQNVTEAILVRDGLVTEGTHTSVAAVIDGEIRVHPLTHLVLPSITRAVAIELAHRIGIPVREVAFTQSDIARVSELFLLSTTSDVMPIVRVDGQRVGSGEPGPIAAKLYKAFRAHIDEACGATASH